MDKIFIFFDIKQSKIIFFKGNKNTKIYFTKHKKLQITRK